jgi:uncharacterized repeat protein (TIGR02543 family)
MQDTAVAKGSAWHQAGGTLSGNAIVDGDYMFNKSISGGITFGHLPFVGIPDNFTTATPTGHYASYDFSSAHDSRALDRFGVTDAFPIGSPPWTATDWKRRGFLSFNGSDQYVALDRSVADTRAFTFAAWVKPTESTANQAILWLGATSSKRLSITPKDANGQLRFSIVNGGAEQSLTSSALPTGVWSHVAVSLDGSTGILFINGAAVATGAITITPDQLLAANTTTGAQHNYLARSEGTIMSMFKGDIDDVQFYSSALNATQLAAVTVPLASDLLLSDNFDSGSYTASSFNSTLAADQQGLLAPLNYSVTGYNADYKIQHGNGGQLLMASWFGGESLDLYASLNNNFATEVNGLNKPLKIQFDLKITDSSHVSNWATIAIGSAQNAFVNNSSNKFSSLFRLSGGTQQFASGADVSVSGLSWNPNGSTIAVVLSDTGGNGSPFNGNGSVARLYVNGVLSGTWTLAQMGPTDGYISFEGYGVFANYDNLSISVVTETTYGVTYNGNTNTGGGVPIDTVSPYAPNTTVTVLGNSGALVKTGYTFGAWNTAADGSGTAYEPGDTFSITAPVTLYAQWMPGPDFFWNNSAGTNLWNTTAANWLGVPWVNSLSNNAWFESTGGGIMLAAGLTAGAVNVGKPSTNFPASSFSGGSLSAVSINVQGLGVNNGDYASNPVLTLNSTVILSGDAAIGRANLAITGGSLAVNRIISNTVSADWGRLSIDGGNVTAHHGVDGFVNTAATFQLELNGGTLETSSLRIANRDLNDSGPGGNNDAHLIWNGGTLKAIGPDNDNFIILYGDGSNGGNPTQATYVRSGGAIIDTNGRNIGIPVKLLAADGSGGLTKNGGGMLTLTASNSYRGPTTINAGKLRLGNGSSNTNLADSADVMIAAGAVIDLHYSGTDIIDELIVGGIAQSPGIYSSSNSSNFITGAGTLTVINGPPSDYEIWKTANNIAGGPADDDDSDGANNQLEYAFGLNPKNAGSCSPYLDLAALDSGKFTYMRRKTALSGLTYTVWISNDLTSWSVDSGNLQAVIRGAGDVETVQVTLSARPPDVSRLFIRISAQ